MSESAQSELNPRSFFFDEKPGGYCELDQFPSEPGGAVGNCFQKNPALSTDGIASTLFDIHCNYMSRTQSAQLTPAALYAPHGITPRR